jgi:hypothetical protein
LEKSAVLFTIDKPLKKSDFARINAVALPNLISLLQGWLRDGKLVGGEFVARNPRRADHSPGSFKINIRTGRWADFATSDRGGDVISLLAFLENTSQTEAARRLAAILGVSNVD